MGFRLWFLFPPCWECISRTILATVYPILASPLGQTPTTGLPKFCLCPACEHSKCVQHTADDITAASQLWKLYTPLWSNRSKNRLLQPKLIKQEYGLPPGAGSHQHLTATPSQKVWRSSPHIHPILKFTLPTQSILPSPLCCEASPGGQRPLLFQLCWPLL